MVAIRSRPVAFGVLAVLVAACGGGSQVSPGAPATTTASPEPTIFTAAPATASATPELTPGANTFINPVFPNDFPDPHILRVEDTYYGYATNTARQNVPVVSSEDLAQWKRERDAMPPLPPWAALNFGNTWAPGLIHIDETFVLYHTSRDSASGRQCIGVATSDSPVGPFEHASDQPLICQADLGGSIDAYPVRDEDGQLYVYWKNDGNCCGIDVKLWGQRLTEDGLELVGEAEELISRDQAWEIPLIENPAMVHHEDRHYLFYSGNKWDSPDYAVGYAVCETAVGPCEKPLDEPLFGFTPQVMGPGGQAFFSDPDGDLWMAYHAWTAPATSYPRGTRSLRIEPVAFENETPVIAGPTVEPQQHDGA